MEQPICEKLHDIENQLEEVINIFVSDLIAEFNRYESKEGRTILLETEFLTDEATWSTLRKADSILCSTYSDLMLVSTAYKYTSLQIEMINIVIMDLKKLISEKLSSGIISVIKKHNTSCILIDLFDAIKIIKTMKRIPNDLAMMNLRIQAVREDVA